MADLSAAGQTELRWDGARRNGRRTVGQRSSISPSETARETAWMRVRTSSLR